MTTDKAGKAAKIKAALIAPCGMNCALCLAFQRDKKPCPGCGLGDTNKPQHCRACAIKNCAQLAKTKYCFQCGSFPCARLRSLDRRYRGKYGMSMLENLEAIKELGLREFVRREKMRWACPECGAVICVHREACPACGHSRRAASPPINR